ncbi:MAG: hypothetical protein KF729_36400 [Sandaracinaceae bacterium]|nr:hypothetical protein [Sandaracinaceae bacterium]
MADDLEAIQAQNAALQEELEAVKRQIAEAEAKLACSVRQAGPTFLDPDGGRMAAFEQAVAEAKSQAERDRSAIRLRDRAPRWRSGSSDPETLYFKRLFFMVGTCMTGLLVVGGVALAGVDLPVSGTVLGIGIPAVALGGAVLLFRTRGR